MQSEPHVGHVRSGVNFDVLRRWLTTRGDDAHFIRNITDIEDKVLAKSAEQGRPWYNLAYAMWIDLDKAYDALNVAPPTHEPAASGHVPEMIEIIVTLIGRGPRIRSRGQLRGRLLRRAVTARVRRAHRPEARGYGPLPKMPTRAVNGTARLRAVEGLEAGGGAGERGVAQARGVGGDLAGTSRARRWR